MIKATLRRGAACMNAKTIRLAFRASLPVMAGYLVLGLGFGVLLHSHGYGPIWAFFDVP